MIVCAVRKKKRPLSLEGQGRRQSVRMIMTPTAVWGYLNEHVRMSFLGLFNFNAPYLPWVLLFFSLLLGASPVDPSPSRGVS